MKTIITLLLFILSTSLIFSQSAKSNKVIRLINPSFEGIPQPGKTPKGWQNCGFPGETPPDIQPEPTFLVTAKPQHGNTYLGMVVRDNDTWERVGQKLSSPIMANQCYQFSIHLQRSETYRSRSHVTTEVAAYTTPTKLKIWGGNKYCAKAECLIESKVILHNFWEMYTFSVKAKEQHKYILLEVFYEEPILFPYNGNLLLDNASDFVPIACNSLQSSAQTISHAGLDVAQKTPSTKKRGIFYYSSSLDSEAKRAFLERINNYLKTDPPYSAMIYVKEKKRKQGKKSIDFLKRQLTNMGWGWKDFTLEFVKGTK